MVRERLYAENLARIRSQKEQALMDRLGIRMDMDSEITFSKLVEEMEKQKASSKQIEPESGNIFASLTEN